MLRILSDSLKLASRQKDWDSPDYWRFTDRRPMPDNVTREARRRNRRHWLRDTGIM